MIDGIGKNDRYNIGSNRNMETRWTAVRVDEEWRLIHVDWGLKLRRHGKRKVNLFMNTGGLGLAYCSLNVKCEIK